MERVRHGHRLDSRHQIDRQGDKRRLAGFSRRQNYDCFAVDDYCQNWHAGNAGRSKSNPNGCGHAESKTTCITRKKIAQEHKRKLELIELAHKLGIVGNDSGSTGVVDSVASRIAEG